MSFFNVHTHIFNLDAVPNAFVSNYNINPKLASLLRGALKVTSIRKILLTGMRLWPSRLGNGKIKRYMALLEVAMHKSQSEVFDDLISNYDDEARFVALTMNFDFMTGEVPDTEYNNYETQIHEILQIKKSYGDKILPFLYVDPRMGGKESLDMVRKYFSKDINLGMVGIKLYPSLGYLPFHPNLEAVYAYAEEHRIPIMTHCYKGGGTFYAGRFTHSMMSYNSFNPRPVTAAFLDAKLKPFDPNRKGRYYPDIMIDPILFEDVLTRFPKLKICMGHYGGDEEILNQYRSVSDNWTKTIKYYMKNYENVYADVSYTLAYEDVNKEIINDLKDPVLQSKILFGTDYFLVTAQNKENKLVANFFDQLNSPQLKQLLTETNPKAYLKSDFFTP